MGCLFCSLRKGSHDDSDAIAMFTFWPGLRIPVLVDIPDATPTSEPLQRLFSLRARITTLACDLAGESADCSSGSACETGGIIDDLHNTLEEYLPLLLCLVKGNELLNKVNFIWKNQEASQRETAMPDVYYEVISVLHIMAVLLLMQANTLLLRSTNEQPISTSVVERKNAIDKFLKASGMFECAIKVVSPKLSPESKEVLPTDLTEDILGALSMQALGLCVEIQLGLAIADMKATLAVKRRLACEQVKYWQKAHENIGRVHLAGCWGKKHELFLGWKLAEAKAAAYYFHGLILDEGNEEATHAKAVLCLQTADLCLKESKKLSTTFCIESPTTRTHPSWGAMKYLMEKIPRDYALKEKIRKEMYSQERIPDQIPVLPEFQLSLSPDEFSLPEDL